MRPSSLCAWLLVGLCSLALGCGEDEQQARVSGTPDPEHAREVAGDPYALTCNDLARQTLHPESAKLVIRAEFAMARDPRLRKLARRLTLNRTGRSVYYGLTEVCKGRRPSFRPGRPRVPFRTQAERRRYWGSGI